MRHLSQADYKRTPWKNGGGETVELAAFPPGAGLDDFIWRVSMARIDRDGPFSCFEGIDRTILVHSGNGIALAVDGVETTLRLGDPASRFAGDAQTMCRLLDGPVTDINIMSRRSAASHEVALLGPQDAVLGRDTTLLLTITALRLEEYDKELAPADLVVIQPGESLTITRGAALAIHLAPLGTQPQV